MRALLAFYQIQVGIPLGYVATAEHAGAPNVDSDIDGTGLTDSFVPTSTELNSAVDAGFFCPATTSFSVCVPAVSEESENKTCWKLLPVAA